MKVKKIIIFGLNNIGNKILKFLKRKKIKIFLIKNKPSLLKVKKFKPDLILSLGYRSIVPREFLKIPKLGAYNMHKSLLPMNKGANPVFWTILNMQNAGISIHHMNSKIDNGPIVMQKKINFDFSNNAKDIYEKLEIYQYKIFKEFWKKINKGKLKIIKNKYLPSYHKKKDFLDKINLKSIDKKKFLYFLNFLRASTFPPFKNIIIQDNKKKYHVEIKIKEIKKNLKIKYGKLKSYK